MTFGEFITQKRLALDMEQQDLAEAIGLSAPYMSNIIAGRKPMPQDESMLSKLAAVLRLSRDDQGVLFDLAAQAGYDTNALPIDLTGFLQKHRGTVFAALRVARDANVSDDQFEAFMARLHADIQSQQGGEEDA